MPIIMNQQPFKPPSYISFYPAEYDDDCCSEITESLLHPNQADTAHHHDDDPRLVRYMTTEQQQIYILKQHLIEQQALVQDLQSRLTQCQLENEELKSENAVLIEERIVVTD